MRTILQNFAAGLASLAIPVLGALWILHAGANAGNPADDAPQRGAALFLITIPLMLFGLVIVFTVLGAMLRLMGGPSLARLLGLGATFALVPAIAASIAGFTHFGVRDGAISVLMFGSLAILSIGPGCLVWWALRPKEDAPSLGMPKEGGAR